MLAAHFGNLFDRRSVSDMTAVLQCKGYPGSHVELFHHRENDPDLVEPCLRLNGEKIRSGFCQSLHAQLVKGTVLTVRKVIVARIFGTVGKISTIRADGTRDQTSFRLSFRMTNQKIIASFTSQRHRLSDKPISFLRVNSALFESSLGRLVAGGNGNVGSRFEIISVHLSNLVRFFNEYARTPELVVEVTTCLFKCCGHGAVNHDGTALTD